MLRFGPTPRESRPTRPWEAHPDRYVFFGQSQALFHFSIIHPRLWSAYNLAAKVRCAIKGHEYSRLIESDKYVSNPKARTHCLFCGKSIVVSSEDHPGPLMAQPLDE